MDKSPSLSSVFINYFYGPCSIAMSSYVSHNLWATISSLFHRYKKPQFLFANGSRKNQRFTNFRPGHPMNQIFGTINVTTHVNFEPQMFAKPFAKPIAIMYISGKHFYDDLWCTFMYDFVWLENKKPWYFFTWQNMDVRWQRISCDSFWFWSIPLFRAKSTRTWNPSWSAGWNS